METKQFFADVLKALNIAPSQGAIEFLTTWANFEKRAPGKPHGFNPLNTTKDMKKIDPQQTNFNTNAGYPVKSYSTYNVGVKATADTLKLPYYKNIVKALSEGLTPGLAYQRTGIARELRTWGTHTLANKFVDGAVSKKPNPKQAKETEKKTKGNIIVMIAVLFVVGGLVYLYLNLTPNI